MKRSILLLLILILSYTVSAEEPPVITVLDFKTNDVSEGDMQSIISLLSSALFKTGRFRIIDVAQRNTILAELEFSAQDCSDEACQLEIGKLLSAGLIVVGNIGKVGNRFVISSKILETETGNTISASDGIYDKLDALVDDIYNFAIALSGEPVTVAEKPEPPVEEKAEVKEEEPEEKPVVETEKDPAGSRRTAAFACAGGGVVTLGGGIFFVVNALGVRKNRVEPSYEAYQSGDQDYDGDFTSLTEDERAEYFTGLYDTYLDNLKKYRWRIITGLGLTVGGVALGGVSALLFLLPDKEAPADGGAELALSPIPGGALLSLRVRY